MDKFHRPCTIWGSTFDAFLVTGVYIDYKSNKVVINLADNEEHYFGHFKEGDYLKADKLIREANIAISKALNAPITITSEVLKDLPNEDMYFEDVTWQDMPSYEVQISPNAGYVNRSYKEEMWMEPFWASDDYGSQIVEGWFVYHPYYTLAGDWNIQLMTVEGMPARACNAETLEYFLTFTLDGKPKELFNNV